jgi:hypothetical protein
MENIVMAVRLMMASVLLWAGLEKVRSPGSVASTMRQIGVPGKVVGSAGKLLVTLELATAFGVIFAPGSWGVISGLLVLTTAFTVAGAIGLVRPEPIHCGCFGPGGGGYLGMRQLAGSPFWMAGAALLWLEGPTRPTFREGIALFTLVSLTVAGLRSVSALRATASARSDRLSATEMLTWLRR